MESNGKRMSILVPIRKKDPWLDLMGARVSKAPLVFIYLYYMGLVKRKRVFEHAQATHIQIILRMLKTSSGFSLSNYTFCSI